MRVVYLLGPLLGLCVLTANCSRRNRAGTKKPASRLVRPLVFNPKNEWDNFVRQAERNERRDKERRQKMIEKLRLLTIPGPQGPRGPQGPPGAVITKRDMLREFRKLMKAFVEDRLQLGIFDKSLKCVGNTCNETNKPGDRPPVFAIGRVKVVPRILRSFTWESYSNVTIAANRMQELPNFRESSVRGSHNRCITLHDGRMGYTDECNGNETVEDGRYVVNRTGIYTFFANLHFLRDVLCLRGRHDQLTVALCIDSQCDENMSLKTISSPEETTFTKIITGFLYLKRGHYVSLYVDNSSKCPLNVLEKSHMSGILTGI